ncbi:MAG: peptidase M41, partial [Hymenobacter sp.]
MSDTTPTKRRKPTLPNPTPRPGVQLWVMAGLLVLFIGMFWFNNQNAAIKINQQKFEQMLAAGDVHDVSLVNKQTVEVGLTPAALQKPEYQKDLTAHRGPFADRGAQYYFPIVDAKYFQEQLEKLQANQPREQRLQLDPVDRVGLFDI